MYVKYFMLTERTPVFVFMSKPVHQMSEMSLNTASKLQYMMMMIGDMYSFPQ